MKKVISVLLVISLIFLFCIEKKFAYADAITVSQIASAAYAYGESAGINFMFSQGTEIGSEGWMTSEINHWLAGRTVTEAFGTELLRAELGKLIIPASIAMKLNEFLTDLVERYSIDEESQIISKGSFDGLPVAMLQTSGYLSYGSTPSDEGLSIIEYTKNQPWSPEHGPSGGNYGFTVYYNGSFIGHCTVGSYYTSLDGWYLDISNNNRFNFYTVGTVSSSRSDPDKDRYQIIQSISIFNYIPDLTDRIDASLNENYGYPEFPDVGYNWEGDIGAAPDTNLDQLIGTIFEEVADNNLSVDGEVVEPAPAPTPVPTFEPYPPVDDILPGINTGIEIGNDLIVGQQAQTGAITQGLEGVQEAIGSLEGTLEAIADTPAEEDLPDFKFDLRELFPFCIPFDIYRLLSSFDAEPAAPHVQLPIVIESIGFSYNLDLDFSSWNPVAQAMRTAELIVYAIGLAWATGKVIKW